jgi:hypothetical protein
VRERAVGSGGSASGGGCVSSPRRQGRGELIVTWKIDIVRTGGGFKWKLFNRHGELVMVSRETYPTRGSARAAAEYERNELRHLQIAA